MKVFANREIRNLFQAVLAVWAVALALTQGIVWHTTHAFSFGLLLVFLLLGGEVVGINTETFDGNKTAIKEAKTLLKSQGAKYRNLSIDSSSDAGKYASDIMAFPTTILVDRNGNIVGDPMLGGIDNQDNYDTLMKQIQSVIDADSTKK